MLPTNDTSVYFDTDEQADGFLAGIKQLTPANQTLRHTRTTRVRYGATVIQITFSIEAGQ